MYLWRKTLQLRREHLSLPQCDVKTYVDLFPAIKSVTEGPKLVDIDFEQQFPGRGQSLLIEQLRTLTEFVHRTTSAIPRKAQEVAKLLEYYEEIKDNELQRLATFEPMNIWMTMERLELILEEPDKIFFSGDDIRGQVMVYLSASIAVQAVAVKFIGEACVSVPEGVGEEKTTKKRKNVTNKIVPINCEPGATDGALGWTQDKSPGPGTPAKLRSKSSTKSSLGPKPVFSSNEKYFFHKEYLYGHKYSSFREKLWAGNHAFPFQFTLPAQLPASFNGRFGYVRYYAEALLLRWKEKEVRRVYFSVTNVADINTETRAESGCEEQKSTNSCFFCCPRGTIVASAELKRRGFAPGEIAPLLVEIHNMSNSSITTLKAVILQMVEYSSAQGLRRHEDERRVLEVNRGEVKPGASMSWGSAGVRLPPLPPSSFAPDSCKIISIQYRMDVMMYISGMRDPLTLRLPIIIGNIPLKRHFPGLSSHAEVAGLLEAAFPRPILSRYPHLPGTTNQESINPEQSECVYKLPTFKPRYLVYVPKTLIK